MREHAIVIMQMDIVYGQPLANRQHVQLLFEQAALQKNEVVILPEMWNTAYDLTHLAEIADEEGVQTQGFLRELAQHYQVTIIGGSVAVKEGMQFFNRTYVFLPDGTLASQYDKVHLFGLMQEDQYLQAGAQLGLFSVAGTQFSQSICYDLRFPEWYRQAAYQGAEVYTISAQWPAQRLAQWRKLVQARAIENQAFVIAVNRVGSDPANHFPGHSLVIDPLGEILLELSESEEVARITIDVEQLAAVRGEIPVFQDTRPNLYETIRKEGEK